jgi:hypothetical protein
MTIKLPKGSSHKEGTMRGLLSLHVAIVGAVTAVTAGAAGFTGTAFAHDHYYDGNDGDSNANCVLPIGASVGIIGQGGDNTQCNAAGGGY